MTEIEYRAIYTTPYQVHISPNNPYVTNHGTSKENVIAQNRDLRNSEETLPTILYWETREVTRTPWQKENS